MVIWGVALTLSESSLLLHHNLSWGKWACGRDPWGQCSLAPLANCGACKKFNKQLPSGWPSFVGRYSELTMKQGKYVDSQKRLDQHHRLETSPGGPWWLWGGMEGHGRCRVYSLLLEFAFISSVECSCSMALHVSAKHPAGWSPSLTGEDDRHSAPTHYLRQMLSHVFLREMLTIHCPQLTILFPILKDTTD